MQPVDVLIARPTPFGRGWSCHPCCMKQTWFSWQKIKVGNCKWLKMELTVRFYGHQVCTKLYTMRWYRGISYDKGYIWSSTIIKGHTARKKKNVEEIDKRENGKKQMDENYQLIFRTSEAENGPSQEYDKRSNQETHDAVGKKSVEKWSRYKLKPASLSISWKEEQDEEFFFLHSSWSSVAFFRTRSNCLPLIENSTRCHLFIMWAIKWNYPSSYHFMSSIWCTRDAVHTSAETT